MAKKTKISIAVILGFVAIITSVLIALSLNTVSYYSNIARPSRIVVYYQNQYNNIVFEPDDVEYEKIYSLLIDGYRKPIIKSFIDDDLSKNVVVNISDRNKINFTDINIAFVYNTPQVLKSNGKIHSLNGENYWFKTLIFNVKNNNSFKYNTIAVIPNENDINYIDEFDYNVSLQAYSNFNSLYNYIYQLF